MKVRINNLKRIALFEFSEIVKTTLIIEGFKSFMEFVKDKITVLRKRKSN